jgi:hypothetical protein
LLANPDDMQDLLTGYVQEDACYRIVQYSATHTILTRLHDSGLRRFFVAKTEEEAQQAAARMQPNTQIVWKREPMSI